MATANLEPPEYECPVCNDYFKQPKLLLCGHDLCRDCLVSLCNSSVKASCPLCRCPIESDQRNANDPIDDIVNNLPDDLAMAAVVECARILGGKQECNIHNDIAAVSFCLQCNEMLCSTCLDFHKKQKATRHHVVEDLSSLTPVQFPANRQATCTTHTDRTAELFCSQHHVPLCLVCAIVDHRDCPELDHLEKKGKTIRRELDQLLTKLNNAELKLNETLSKINNHVTEIDQTTESDIQEMEEIYKRFLKLAESCLERHKECVRDSSSQKKTRILGTKETITNLHGRFISHKVALKRVQQTVSGSELFDMTATLTKRTHELELDHDQCLPSDLEVFYSQTVDPNTISRFEHELTHLPLTSTQDVAQVTTIRNAGIPGYIDVTFDYARSRLALRGFEDTVRVLPVHTMIKDADKHVQCKVQADLLAKQVQWSAVAVSETEEVLQPYSRINNYLIETAYSGGKTSVVVKCERTQQHVNINFAAMEELPENPDFAKGVVPMRIIRHDLLQGMALDAPLPDRWTDMKREIDVVPLSPKNPDYRRVAEAFNKIPKQLQQKIKMIFRVQNKTLHKQYMAMRKQIVDSLPPGKRCERDNMWHGTKEGSVDGIVRYGFNRSYSNCDANNYGQGVYFATEAEYSIRDAYATRNSRGDRHIFMCKVLVGEYTVGKPEMRFPPEISGSNGRRYNSVVDDKENPSTFVIFSDVQAYPEYLIVFKQFHVIFSSLKAYHEDDDIEEDEFKDDKNEQTSSQTPVELQFEEFPNKTSSTTRNLQPYYGMLERGTVLNECPKLKKEGLNKFLEETTKNSFLLPFISDSWQMSSEFSSKGGQMQEQNSDVVLYVPENAIESSSSVTIRTAVSTNLQMVHELFGLDSEEMIVSPVAEFTVEPNIPFKKSVWVILPHFLTQPYSPEHVNVYRFQNKTLEPLQFEPNDKPTAVSESNQRDGFSVVKDGKICIFSSHFTGFFCTQCNRQLEPDQLYLRAYGQYKQRDKREVKLLLFVWDGRLHIKDFEKVLLMGRENTYEVQNSGLLDAAPKDPKVCLGIEFLLQGNIRNSWNFTEMDGHHLFPPNTTRNLENILCQSHLQKRARSKRGKEFPCCCYNRKPLKIEWALEERPGCVPSKWFQCAIRVGYSTTFDPEPLNFLENARIETLHVNDLELKEARNSFSQTDSCETHESRAARPFSIPSFNEGFQLSSLQPLITLPHYTINKIRVNRLNGQVIAAKENVQHSISATVLQDNMSALSLAEPVLEIESPNIQPDSENGN